MRGEQLVGLPHIQRHTGSPPLARGTARKVVIGCTRRGITPACAGKRLGAGGKSMAIEDHPRLRGEQYPSETEDDWREGSPPLARGTG